MNTDQLRQTAAAIIAYAEGKPIQYRWLECKKPDYEVSKWKDLNGTIADGIGWTPQLEHMEYRIKPMSRPWSKPEDVPGSVCWVRFSCDGPAILVVMVTDQGIGLYGNTVLGYSPKLWSDIGDWEHSTDRKTWHPCTVEEQP